MKAKLPRITAAEACRAVEKAGFSVARQSGSRRIYKSLTLPIHAKKTLHPKLVKAILRDADLTPERLKELCR